MLWFWDDDCTNFMQFFLRNLCLAFQTLNLHRNPLLRNFNQKQLWMYRNYRQITQLYQLYPQFLLLVYHYLTSLLNLSLVLLLTSSFGSQPYLLSLLDSHIHRITLCYYAWKYLIQNLLKSPLTFYLEYSS